MGKQASKLGFYETTPKLAAVFSRRELERRFPNLFMEPPELTPQEQAARQAKHKGRLRREEQAVRYELLSSFLGQLGKRHRECTFRNYALEHDGQKQLVAALREYAANAPEEVSAGNGIVLFGPSGTGKDHLLIATARELIGKHGMAVSWRNGLDVYGDFRDAITNDTLERSLIQELTRPPVLIVSDPIPPRGMLTDYQGATMLRILDHRYRACRPTWASMNVAGGQEADHRLGSPLVDRLRHGALTAHCKWPSYRTGRSIGADGKGHAVRGDSN